jgi:hypothetical protein
MHRVIRIIFVIPVFAVIAFLSVASNDAAIYLKPIEDLYEAFALACFFLLLCAFVQESDEERQSFFTSSGTTKQYLVLIHEYSFIISLLTLSIGCNHRSFSVSSRHAHCSRRHRNHGGYRHILCYVQQIILRSYLGKNFLLPVILKQDC